MEKHINDSLIKLAESIEALADSIEKDAASAPVAMQKEASLRRDFSFGRVTETPDKGDPLLNFILS